MYESILTHSKVLPAHSSISKWKESQTIQRGFYSITSISGPAGRPVGTGAGSCMTIIINSNRQPWIRALQWPLQSVLLFNSTCYTVGLELKFLPSECLTTEINVFSIGDRQVLSESVRLKKSNRKICIISSLTNLALALG